MLWGYLGKPKRFHVKLLSSLLPCGGSSSSSWPMRLLVLRRVLLTFGLRRWLGTENPPNLAWVWRISRNILSTLQDYRAFSLLPPISQQLSLSSGLIYNAIWNRFRINRAKYNKWSLKTGNDALSLYDFQKSNTQKQGGGLTRLYYESFCIFYEFLFTFY